MMKRAGFTLMELIMVILIMMLIAGIAIPTFSRWLPNYRLRAAARDIFSHFQLAKITSIKKNTTCAVTFRQAVGGTTFDYVLYVDSDRDVCYDAGEEVLLTVLLETYRDVDFDTGLGGGDGISFDNNADTLPSVGFLSNGLATGGGSVFLINPNGRQNQVDVSAAGNISLQ